MRREHTEFHDIAGSLAIEAISEIEDMRDFPILDRERFDALRAMLADGFAQVLAHGYRTSLEKDADVCGEMLAEDVVGDFAAKLAEATRRRPRSTETRAA